MKRLQYSLLAAAGILAADDAQSLDFDEGTHTGLFDIRRVRTI